MLTWVVMPPRKDTDLSARLNEVLREFRRTHDKRFLEVGSDAWEYMIGGTTASTIIIVGGGGSTAESMFTVSAALEPSARVLSLGIPTTISNAERVIMGMKSILDSQHITRAILLGHSLGGLVVQAFAVRHPERVAGMVLSNTGFYVGIRAMLMPALAELMARAPNVLVLSSVSRQMNRLLKSVEAPSFWQQFFQQELARPDSAKRLRQQLVLLADLVRFFRVNPIAEAGARVQSLPVQIISSEDDKGFTRRETAFLGSLYPNSHTMIFPRGSTHLSFLTRPHEYIDVVQRFLASVDRGVYAT
jgi:pimeloyl-ACP methyl ester carboxylesterase